VVVRFDTSGISAGGHLERMVTAVATDADGLTATRHVFVEIHEAASGADLPPICQFKPWLPQCRNVP
jgi:hypothetical protein